MPIENLAVMRSGVRTPQVHQQFNELARQLSRAFLLRADKVQVREDGSGLGFYSFAYGSNFEILFTFSLSSSAVMLQEPLSELLPHLHCWGISANAEPALSKSAASIESNIRSRRR